MDRQDDIRRRLMATFQAELEDHLGVLNKGLLALEGEDLSGEERERFLADLFRAAHSVKGAARAVGLREIETIAHRMEDLLGAVQRGKLTLGPKLFDLLFPAVDALREAMVANLRGESLPAEQRGRIMAGLEAALPDEASSPVQPPELKPELVSPSPESYMSQDATPRPITAEETIRVATSKLDKLMDCTGELLVARMRSDQRLAELQALRNWLIRWEKSWRQARGRFSHLKRQKNGIADTSLLLDFLLESEEQLVTLNSKLNSLLSNFTSDNRFFRLLTDDLQDSVRRVRMVPISTLFDPLPRMIRDLAHEQGKEMVLEVEGGETELDRQVLEAMKDPVIHLLRNIVDHGIESPEQREAAGKARLGTVRLRAAQAGASVVLEAADDGAGIDLEAVRRAAVEREMLTAREAAGLGDRETMEFIFRSGLSTSTRVTELSGRGVGLDVVRKNLEQLHGLIEVETSRGQGAAFTLTLPLTLASIHVLLVEVANQMVAIPTTTLERISRVDPTAVSSVQGRLVIHADGRPLPLVSLAQMLDLPHDQKLLEAGRKAPVIVMGAVEKRVAFLVDALHGTREVVIKNMGRQLRRVRNVAGAAILGTGQVVIILNVVDLMNTALAGSPPITETSSVEAGAGVRRRVLVVDDSITTRTLEKNIIENAGYEVLVAADGLEAWALIQCERLDVIVSDVAMPRMDGFALTEKVKDGGRFNDIPVVLVTSLDSPRDRIRGMEAGADAYIAKGAFDQQELLETIERLIG